MKYHAFIQNYGHPKLSMTNIVYTKPKLVSSQSRLYLQFDISVLAIDGFKNVVYFFNIRAFHNFRLAVGTRW